MRSAWILTLALVACSVDSRLDQGRIRITGDDSMRFSRSSIRMLAGEELEIEFANVGRMEIEQMGHNFVILTPGSSTQEFGIAAVKAANDDYIPESHRDRVLAHTRLLGPGESEVIRFAPPKPGIYPYLCSFKGHAPTMRGQISVVTSNE